MHDNDIHNAPASDGNEKAPGNTVSREYRLGHEKIPKLLFSLAIPSIIAQLVNLLYNVVDRIYIGRMADGPLAMSAISVSLPVITFIMAVTMLLGAGGAPLAAIRMGQNDHDGAERIMSASFSSLLVSGVFLTLLILIFHRPVLFAFGASESNITMASQYICIYSAGTIFVQIAIGMNPYIITQGYAFLGMITVLIGTILNIILDPVFIFVFNMGVSGAALATIISQAVSAVWALSFLFGEKTGIRIRRRYLVPRLKTLGSICALGVSPFIMNSTESLIQIAFNNQLSLYGGTLAVGSMSILVSLFHMVNFPLQGLCQGGQPIMSYNYGAGNLKRVRETFRLLFICCFSVSFICIGSIIVFSDRFAAVFTGDPQLIRLTGWALKVYLSGAVIFGAQIACQQSFVALGQAKQSLSMALYRKIILLIPLIFILPPLIGSSSFAVSLSAPAAGLVGNPGCVFSVLLAEAISDALAAVTTSCLFCRFYKSKLL